MNPLDWIWLGADVRTRDEYYALTGPLLGVIRNVKIRRHLTDAAGLDILHDARRQGFRVFDDAKLYDIPNSMKLDVETHLAQQPAMLNCLAECGPEAMAMMAKLCTAAGVESIAVTVLTSKGKEVTKRQSGRLPATQVKVLAQDAADAGMDSILCSPEDLAMLEKTGLMAQFRNRYTPAVRPIWANANDQARPMTPAEAYKAGSTGGIMGRPIYDLQYGQPKDNVDRICEELAAVM